MNPVDRCRDLREALPDYAAGLADDGFALRVQDHPAEGCPHCAAEIDALTLAFLAIPLQGPPEDGAALDVLARAEKAIAGQPQDRPEDVLPWPRDRENGLLRALVLLFAVALGLAGLWAGWDQRARREVIQDRDRAETQARRASGDYRVLRERSERAVGWLELSMRADAPTARLREPGGGLAIGRVVQDPDTPRILVALHRVPGLPSGDVLALWAQGLEAPFPLGSLPPPLPDGRVGPVALDLPAPVPAGTRLVVVQQSRGATPASPGPPLVEGTLLAPATAGP
jgi:hypothetical protein